MIDSIKITYVDSVDKETWFLTPEQWKYFGLDSSNKDITLVLGSTGVHLKKVILGSDEMNSNRLYLSKDMERQLYIAQGSDLQIRKMDDRNLEIGPYIGIFVNKNKIESLTSGKNVSEYIQFHSTCKKLNGLCCFFSIEGIDWDKRLVQGVIRENSGWVTKTLPLPIIIYDRNVQINCRVESKELRERLKGVCQFLNPMVKLSKWETIKAIEKNHRLVSVLPKTIQYESSNSLDNSLKLYKSLYVKPDSLSKGKGIFRVSINQNKKYRIEYRTPEKNHTVSLESLKDLEILMSKYLEAGGGYIIQQEIHKATFRGNPFDFRALFQKDFQGVWQLSGTAGRVTGLGSVITSPRSGGTVVDLEVILKEVFNESFSTSNGLYENIVRLGREICLSIEKEFGDCIEFGLDMAIDTNKKLWLVEANGKPLKVSLKRLDNLEIMARCNRRPMEYAVKRSGFVSEDTHG